MKLVYGDESIEIANYERRYRESKDLIMITVDRDEHSYNEVKDMLTNEIDELATIIDEEEDTELSEFEVDGNFDIRERINEDRRELRVTFTV